MTDLLHIPDFLRRNPDAKMDIYTATGIAEGFIKAETDEQYWEAWQRLIDTGVCWQLQGRFGRTARDLILSGQCTPPPREGRPI